MESIKIRPRNCGQGRDRGGLYVEDKRGPGGLPDEYFVFDPPLPTHLGPYRGAVPYTDGQGVTHVLIWVGEQFYPYPADFVEEARYQGISRRLPGSFPLEKLSEKSRLLLLHARACLEAADLPPGVDPGCYHRKHGPGEPCMGWLWHVPPHEGAQRRLASRAYEVRAPHIPPEKWKKGIFASYPLGRVVAVRGTPEQDARNAERLKKVGGGVEAEFAEE